MIWSPNSQQVPLNPLTEKCLGFRSAGVNLQFVGLQIDTEFYVSLTSLLKMLLAIKMVHVNMLQ